ncbi:MAG: hypothetical protein LBD22_05120, partial [Spirochaetaceae bacterium]|nr:hypothetical protein [Spirochaetaceae bacterium]
MIVKTVQTPSQKNLFSTPSGEKHFLTIKEASVWAANHLGKNVTTSNISYLIQYGRIRKIEKSGAVFVSLLEL